MNTLAKSNGAFLEQIKKREREILSDYPMLEVSDRATGLQKEIYAFRISVIESFINLFRNLLSLSVTVFIGILSIPQSQLKINPGPFGYLSLASLVLLVITLAIKFIVSRKQMIKSVSLKLPVVEQLMKRYDLRLAQEAEDLETYIKVLKQRKGKLEKEEKRLRTNQSKLKLAD